MKGTRICEPEVLTHVEPCMHVRRGINEVIKRKIGDAVHVWVYDDKEEHLATIEITHTEIRVSAPMHMNIKTRRVEAVKRER